MKDYVSSVLNKIQNKNSKMLISEELQSHIDDRIEYYIDAGYDEETAKAKANANMGDNAELVGEQLNVIHQNNKFLSISVVIVNVVMLAFLCITVLFSIEYDGDWASFLCLTGSADYYFLTGFIIITLAQLYLSLKYKSMVCILGALFNFLCYGVMTKGYIPAVFSFYKIVKGEIKSFAYFTNYYTVKLENKAVGILSIGFLIACAVLALMCLFVIFRFLKAQYSFKTVKFERILKYSVLAVLLITSIVFLYTGYVIENCSENKNYNGTFDGVYVIESDETVNPECVENYDYNYFYVHFDWSCEDVHDYNQTFEYKEDEEIELITSYEFYIKDEHDVSCKIDSVYAEFRPTKKYVMVVPVFEDLNGSNYDEHFPDFSKGEWLDTAEEHTVVLDDYLKYGTVLKTKVKILNR